IDERFGDLRALLSALRRDGALAVVEAEVDKHLEAAEIHRRVIAAGGPALLFTRVKGSDFPLATNLFGTRARAERPFGSRPSRLIERAVELLETLLPPTPSKLWDAPDLLGAAFRVGRPALMLGAGAPLPENVRELMLASLITGSRLPLVGGQGGLPVVGSAEFTLVGRVPPNLRRPEGPFGDHYGYYSLRHDYPVFEVSHLAHRKDAIFTATVVGKPRQEDFFIGDLLQELLSPLFPLVMPAVTRLWSYGETGYHSLAAAVVKQRYKREAMASAVRILGEGQLSLTKFLIVLDREVALTDFEAVLTHLLERTQPETDLFVFSNVSMDTLDYTGPVVNEGSKGVWLGLGDPVRRLPREFHPPVEPPADARDPSVFCPGCLVVGAPRVADDPGAAVRFAKPPAFKDWPLVVVTDDPQRATASAINFLWTTFTRFEPGADVHAAAKGIVRNHVTFTPPIVLDARLKPGFPKELFADEATAATVTARWKEYFPSGVAMGDAAKGHLD